jgi:hypothetical protein
MNHGKMLSEEFDALEKHNRTVELTHMEKQIILYTKGHFTSEIGGINYNRDLKYFAAKIYGLWPKQVEKRTLFHMIVTLYQKLIDAGYIKFDLEEYLSRLMKRAWLHYDMKDISFENILDQMLAEIQGTTVKGMELGEADLSILENK